MSEDNRRLAAIMFTDIVGFSSLTQKDEQLALELLNEHFALLRPIIQEFNGTEIKTIGDMFMIEFVSPLQAVNCGIAFQAALHKRNIDVPSKRKIQIRIGIHLGDVEHQDGDVFGDGVNIASRIEPLADPGGIAITQQVYDHVQNKIDGNFISLGKPELKNIEIPTEIYKVQLHWEVRSGTVLWQTQSSTLGTIMKIGLVMAIAVIGVTGAMFLYQSIFAPSVEDIRTLAILPCSETSQDQVPPYLGEAIASDLISDLSEFDGLRVIDRNSSFSKLLRGLSVKDIGEVLGVEGILKCSFSKNGSELNISAQLYFAASGTNIWRGDFEGKYDEIERTISQVVNEVIEELGLPNDFADSATLTVDPVAFDLYLNGYFHLLIPTVEDLNLAIEYFKRALDLDPQYARAYAGLSTAYAGEVARGNLPDEEWVPLAERYAKLAIDLDAGIAEPYVSLALLEFFSGTVDKAEEFLLQAVDIDNNNALAHELLSRVYISKDLPAEALHQARIAVDVAPLSEMSLHRLARVLLFHGQYTEAAEIARRMLELHPDSSAAYALLGKIAFQQGNDDESIRSFERSIELDPYEQIEWNEYGFVLRINGMWNQVQEAWTEALEAQPQNSRYEFELAWDLLFQGRVEEGLTKAQTALERDPDYQLGHLWMIEMLNNSRQLDEALDYANEWIPKFKTDRWESLSWGYFYLGKTYLWLGDFDSALKAFSDSVKSSDQKDFSLDLWTTTYFAITHILNQEFQLAQPHFDQLFSDRWNSDRIVGRSPWNSNFARALVKFSQGEASEGFAFMHKSVDEREFQEHDQTILAIKLLPLLDDFRDDPRYLALLQRLGLSE